MNRKSLIQFAHLSKQFTYFIRLVAKANYAVMQCPSELLPDWFDKNLR